MRISLIPVLLACVLTASGLFSACGNETTEGNKTSPNEEAARQLLLSRKKEPIKKVPGEDEPVSEEVVQRGEVLINYSDCYVCHREDSKVRGPAFRDIAARYPRNETYIKMLASRVINGGSGAWGYAVMTPHPELSAEDAESMVTFILSLDK